MVTPSWCSKVAIDYQSGQMMARTVGGVFASFSSLFHGSWDVLSYNGGKRGAERWEALGGSCWLSDSSLLLRTGGATVPLTFDCALE